MGSVSYHGGGIVVEIGDWADSARGCKTKDFGKVRLIFTATNLDCGCGELPRLHARVLGRQKVGGGANSISTANAAVHTT